MGWETNIKATTASIVISVDEVSGGELKGSFLHVSHNVQKPFASLAGLVMDLDIIMNQLGVPQSYQELRTWEGTHSQMGELWKAKNSSLTLLLRKGRSATFILYIYLRRNSTWQGEAHWVEGRKQAMFRSALELMHLISSVSDKESYRRLGIPTWMLESGN